MKDSTMVPTGFRDLLIGVIAFLLAVIFWSIVLAPPVI
jgi:hypothetical protein